MVRPGVYSVGDGRPELFVPVRVDAGVLQVPGWRVNPSPVLCHPGCIHCTPPSKAAA